MNSLQWRNSRWIRRHQLILIHSMRRADNNNLFELIRNSIILLWLEESDQLIMHLSTGNVKTWMKKIDVSFFQWNMTWLVDHAYLHVQIFRSIQGELWLMLLILVLSTWVLLWLTTQSLTQVQELLKCRWKMMLIMTSNDNSITFCEVYLISSSISPSLIILCSVSFNIFDCSLFQVKYIVQMMRKGLRMMRDSRRHWTMTQ